jgi:hypothetical protein
MARQFVVQLSNRPGELAHLARALGARGVNIHHISCAGAGPLSCMFVTTDEDDVTRDVLHGLGHVYMEGEPLLVDVEDRPGGLAEISEKLAAGGVNIVGVLPVGRRPGFVEMTFCVDDEARARVLLGLDQTHLVGVSD